MPSWQAVLRGLTYEGIPLWRHTRIIQWVLQVVSGILVVVLVVWFFANISGAIRDRDIPYGFSFLSRAYQTPIGQHFLPYESSDSFLYAFVVATTNTIFVSIVGVILATALGIFIGVSRMSGNWLLSKAALVYIGVLPQRASSGPAVLLVLHSAGASAHPRRIRDSGLGTHKQQRSIDAVADPR